MTNEAITEEILQKAYDKGIGKEVIERASQLIKAGAERHLAFSVAYMEIKTQHEIYRKGYQGQGATSSDGEKRSSANL